MQCNKSISDSPECYQLTNGWAACSALKGWTKGQLCPGLDGAGLSRFHYTTQNGDQFKIYASFIYGNFHLIFFNAVESGITKTVESNGPDKGGLLYASYVYFLIVSSFAVL